MKTTKKNKTYQSEFNFLDEEDSMESSIMDLKNSLDNFGESGKEFMNALKRCHDAFFPVAGVIVSARQPKTATAKAEKKRARWSKVHKRKDKWTPAERAKNSRVQSVEEGVIRSTANDLAGDIVVKLNTSYPYVWRNAYKTLAFRTGFDAYQVYEEEPLTKIAAVARSPHAPIFLEILREAAN